MLYQVSGTVVEVTNEGSIIHQIPTFYLNDRVQGIVNCEHAAKIAEDIVNPAKLRILIPHLYVCTVLDAELAS